MSELIKLDVGSGDSRHEGYTNIDKRALPTVDIVHDLEVFPYPLADESCSHIHASHIIEHIKPRFMVEFMDELWRITEMGGELWAAMPLGGTYSYWQDPTHCNGCNQTTFEYFDPRFAMYDVYRPKPWEMVDGFPAVDNDIMTIKMNKVGVAE